MIPIDPGGVDVAGMIPIFALPGEMTPGVLGPIRLTGFVFRKVLTFIMSKVGMPSVMQTTTLIPASAHSMIASGSGDTAGRKSPPHSRLRPPQPRLRCEDRDAEVLGPALAGSHPGHDLVPYSIILPAWNVPSPPVISQDNDPSFFVDQNAHRMLLRPRSLHQADDPVGGFFHPSAEEKARPDSAGFSSRGRRSSLRGG